MNEMGTVFNAVTFKADVLAGLRAKGLVKPAPLLSAETVAAFEEELRASLRAGLTKIMEARKARAQAGTIPEPAPALTEDYGRATRRDDPETRPASFDNALMAAIPTLTKFARKLSRGDDSKAEELVNDTVVVCLRT